jgi:putative flippase GtrA
LRSPSAGAWQDHREKVLYLVVGAWNTLFSYACFSLLYYLLNEHVFSSVILVASYVLASINGFLGFRYIVFQSRGHPVAEYLRFQLVYLPLLVVNAIALPLFLAYTDLNAYVVQAGWAVFSVIAGYLGNKYFTFRRRGIAEVGPGAAAGGQPLASAADDTERRR